VGECRARANDRKFTYRTINCRTLSPHDTDWLHACTVATPPRLTSEEREWAGYLRTVRIASTTLGGSSVDEQEHGDQFEGEGHHGRTNCTQKLKQLQQSAWSLYMALELNIHMGWHPQCNCLTRASGQEQRRREARRGLYVHHKAPGLLSPNDASPKGSMLNAGWLAKLHEEMISHMLF